jgi:hypothetical protein
MSRDFSKNLSNHMATGQIGAVVNGLAAFFVHLIVTPDTYDTAAGNNRVIEWPIGAGASGVALDINASAAPIVLRVVARSQSGDGAQVKSSTSNLATGVQHFLGAWINIAGDAITPYANGVPEGGGAVTFGAATYTHSVSVGTSRIGANAGTITTALQFDGPISEFSIFNATGWDAAKTNAVAADLALSYSAEFTATRNSVTLLNYMKVLGDDSPELSTVGSLQGTITGSLPQAAHPTIITELPVSASSFRGRRGRR